MSDAYEMKISKLIELLQTAQSTYGDLPVTTGLGRLRGARVIVARDGNVWSVPNGAQNELKVELGEEAAAEITRLRARVAEQEARAAKAEQALAGLRVMADRVFNALTAWKRDAADWDDNISREIDVMVCEALAGYQPDDAKLVSSAILARAGASSPTPPNTQPACANGGESKPEVTG